MKRSPGEKTFNILNIIALFLFMAITLYPIWYVFIISITDTSHSSTANIFLIPGQLTMDSYKAVVLNDQLFNGFKVSFMRVVLGVCITLLNCSLMAYVLSRAHFRAKKFFNVMVVVSMFIAAGMIPFFLVVKSLGMVNTFWGLLIPFTYDPFGIILIRNYFNNIPPSLEESARIDGANDLRIFWNIIIPLSLPILATMALFWSVWFWNDFIYAAFLVTKRELLPIQVILLQVINGQANAASLAKITSRGIQLKTNGESVKNAAIIASIVPILIVYPFVQKYFVQGITLGAVKE
jgi:putative aldouronate transport system permease protein